MACSKVSALALASRTKPYQGFFTVKSSPRPNSFQYSSVYPPP